MPRYDDEALAKAYKRRHDVLALRRSGLSLQEIADRYGVCRERIRQLVRRAEWDERKARECNAP